MADLGGTPPARDPSPLAANFLSISCSFREHLIKFYPVPPSLRVGAPSVKILDPPLITDDLLTNDEEIQVNFIHILSLQIQLNNKLAQCSQQTEVDVSWLQVVTDETGD